MTLPDQARVVIVGGGIMGAGLAYHLGHEGWGADTVLLEKAELTSGSTWHAAGQITRSTSSYGLGRCVDYNIGLYSGGLEAETGQAVTWHGCGSFRLAYTDDEMDWLRHTLSVGRALGFDMELIGPERIAELHPFYNLDGVRAGLHTPDDGHVDPTNVTMALAAGARAKGVRILRRCQATNITRQGDEWVVETPLGTIRCEHVVNAGGTYARQMGEWSGLTLPMTSMTHHYLVTDPVPEFAGLPELPVIRDDRHVSGYIRMERDRGLIGIYEKADPNAVWVDHCPWEAENELFDPDYDRIMPWLEAALDRMPVLAERGIARTVHGAISHPPDGNPMIGPVAPGYWCCCGTQIGIGWGPGLTRELARWMVHGAADMGMREFDPRRFGDWADLDWQVEKAREDYCLRHEIPFPHFNRLAGRPIVPSPLYETLHARGAVHEEVFGFERPRFFVTDGGPQADDYGFGRTRTDGFVDAEVRAVREGAGVIDVTAFTKMRVEGPGAAALLDRLCANRLPKVGRVGLSVMCSEAGRIELETTVIRLAEDAFYLVCAAFFERRLADHLAAHAGDDVTVTSLSNRWGALALNGPEAPHVLAGATDADLSRAAFPIFAVRTISVAGHDVLALRMSYAGEAGWELHMPFAAMADVHAALSAAGAADYGSFAMNVLRMEKGYPGAGELTNEVTPFEAGVRVSADKDWLGRAATEAQPKRYELRLLRIAADGDHGHGGEAVIRDGAVIGVTASHVWSPTLGAALAFAWLPVDATGDVEVVVMGAPRPARVLSEPPYDPAGQRPRAEVLEAAE
ncbi:MAG: FAD-dependent oxidoreductase [Paracoccaceae bacterium]